MDLASGAGKPDLFKKSVEILQLATDAEKHKCERSLPGTKYRKSKTSTRFPENTTQLTANQLIP